MSSPVVEASGLTVGYSDDRVVWRNANFKVSKGEFVALLGSNGVGKTTLFRMILGLIKPISGKLKVFGSEPTKGSPKIGYVPQRRPIDQDNRLEVIEFVRLGLSGSSWRFSLPSKAQAEREEVLQMLRVVDAEALAHRSLGTLSGGELQRVYLAEALMGNPELLLLDEPLANLDIKREVELVSLVKRIIKEKDIAVLLIAHDVNPLLPFVDRIIYIANTHVAVGKVNDVINTKSLSALYGTSVEVLRDSKGRIAVLGAEEAIHHDV